MHGHCLGDASGRAGPGPGPVLGPGMAFEAMSMHADDTVSALPEDEFWRFLINFGEAVIKSAASAASPEGFSSRDPVGC